MKLLKYIFLCLLLCILQYQISYSQKYNFKNYSIREGLSSTIVNNIFQDSKGYTWLGTLGGGISKFDGKNYVYYNRKNGLLSDDINFITEDKEGAIWIATLDGVCKYDQGKFYFLSEIDSVFKSNVYWIYIDNFNKLWFAVREVGVISYDSSLPDGQGNKIQKYTINEGLPSNDIYTINQDNFGNIYFGGRGGISKFDGKKFTTITDSNTAEHIFFSSLKDSQGNLWFGSTTGKVVKYNSKKIEDIILPIEVEGDFIGSIAEDRKGNIWFATYHGVLKYANNKFKLFSEKEGLASNNVLSLACNYEGNLWIGTQLGGVDLFNNESSYLFPAKDILSKKIITCILPIDEFSFVAGTNSSGLIYYSDKDKKFEAIDIKILNSQTINCIVKNTDGKIWVGADNGIYVIENKGKKFELIQNIEHVDGQNIQTISNIIFDDENNFWASSFGSGVVTVKNGVVTLNNKKTSLQTNNILTLFKDSKSNIWLGTYDEGIVKYDGSNYNKLTVANKNINSVWAITEDESGNLFFGTGEEGVLIYNEKQQKLITTKDGLASNNITSLEYEASENVIWVGTNKGVNKLLVDKNLEIQNIKTLNENEGVKGIDISQNGIVADEFEYVWIISDFGLCRYDRKYDVPNLTPPKLYLRGIRMNYQVVDWNKLEQKISTSNYLPENMNLSYKNNNLTFDFQALTTDNVKYSFILEGQDDEWSPLTPNTEANFTNIAPGKKYTFKVKAINSNGIWSKDIIAYTFEIKPPWWQTWWFYILAVITILLLVFGIVNYRTAQLAKEKRKLEEKVEERTVELKDANSKLSVAFQDIKDSINYAQKIQNAILPIDEEIQQALPHSFVFFKPRDVVSGDFYWFNKKNNLIYIAAVDCTGHGVPGAFMSMIGSSLLNEIVNKNESIDAASILKNLDIEVRKSLKQDRDSVESKDGMDLALTIINKQNNTIQYAGAKRSLIYVRNNEVIEIKADKQSIGGGRSHDETIKEFTNHQIQVQQEDSFYMFTDGYVDQFGGEKGKKFSSKKLKETILSLQASSMEKQGVELFKTFEDWRYGIEQVDDVLVIGFRL